MTQDSEIPTEDNATPEVVANVQPVYADPYSAICLDIAGQLTLQKQRAMAIAALEGDGAYLPVDSVDGLAAWLLNTAKRHNSRINYALAIVHDTSSDESQRILDAVARKQQIG